MLRALPLRDYQRQALDARAAAGPRAALVLPTGAGKAVIAAHQVLEQRGRTLFLVDTHELAEQFLDKVRKVAPVLEVGIFMGKDKANARDVVIGGVQTVVRHLAILGGFDQLIVDECHLSAAPTYTSIMDRLGVFEPDGPRLTGYTATFGRNDGKALSRIYPEVPFTRSMSWMIRRQYLIPPVGRIVRVPDLDLTKLRGRDYQDADLGAAMAESIAPELVAKAYLEHGAGRRAIGFAPTVAMAERFQRAFLMEGIGSGVIHGGMLQADRDRILNAHRAGEFPVLWNCMILTKGYDDPQIGCVILARPTKSKILYQQMVGRGVRVDPDRPWADQDCLLLAVVPEVLSHDLASIVDLSERPLKDAPDGKSLIELEDELDAGEGVPDEVPEYYKGPVVVSEFDPIGRPTTRVWLKTRAGTYFVAAGKRNYVFIMEYPHPGQWSVCTLDLDRKRPAMSPHRGLPLDQALVWAEDLALELGVDLNTARGAPWRKKYPSEALVERALGLGLKVARDGLRVTERQGSLSDRIDVVVATRRLDPIVMKVRGK